MSSEGVNKLGSPVHMLIKELFLLASLSAADSGLGLARKLF